MADKQASTLIDAVTRYCRYTGSVATRGYRLSDVLNDGNSSVVEMCQSLATFPGARSAEVRWKETCLKKQDILLVVPKGDYEAPARRRNYYVKKHRYGAMIALPGYILSGIVHLSRRATAFSLLDTGSPLPSFIGITDVTVHSAVHDLLPAQCSVAILQRGAIEAAQLTEQPLGDPIPPARQEETPRTASCH